MYTAAFFRTTQNWKECKNASKGEGIDKLWCNHSMEYDSAKTRNKLLKHSTWRNLTNRIEE